MGYAVIQFDIAGPCNTNIRRALDPDVVVLWVRMDARRVVSWAAQWAAAAVLGDDISCAETELSYLILSYHIWDSPALEDIRPCLAPCSSLRFNSVCSMACSCIQAVDDICCSVLCYGPKASCQLLEVLT